MSNISIVWLRKEDRIGERRTILIPEHAGALVKAGIRVFVEHSDLRIFPDSDYEAQGCSLVGPGSWMTAPKEALIVGLKELPAGDAPLCHRHFYAAHCFDGESGGPELLRRFDAGGGILYAFETLLNDSGHQIGAEKVGFYAGQIGAVLGLSILAKKLQHVPRPWRIPDFFRDHAEMFDFAEKILLPEDCSVLVVAPNGNVGRGVRSVLQKRNLKFGVWGRAETALATRDRTMREKLLTDYDIMFHCISLDNIPENTVTPVLLTESDLLAHPADSRRLAVIADIASYPTHPKNPLPIYHHTTELNDPALQVHGLDIMSIDHLPTLLPLACSVALSKDLFPLLCQLAFVGDRTPFTAWEFATKRFYEAQR